MKKKLTKENFWKFIDKHFYLMFFIIITIFSLVIRWNFIDYKSVDYNSFLQKWFDELKNNGGLLAIKDYEGDYNVPYVIILALLTYIPISPLYSIKIVSIVFDYILAISSMMLVYEFLKNSEKQKIYSLLTYLIIIMLPTVILNSSAWAQCDSMYVAFIIISLIYLMDEKYIKSFIFLGIAFSLKLQFIFVLPVYILLYITKRKFSIYHFLILPLVNFILCIPALILGKSLSSCVTVYSEQTKTYKMYLSMNFPGVYNLFLKGNNLIYFQDDFVSKAGVIFTITIFAIIALVFLYKKVKIKKEDIITLSLWSVMICTFFLPHMHDRYMFAADVLSVLYFMINKDKWYIPIAINFVSLYSYSAYLWGNMSIEVVYVSILNLLMLLIMTKDVYKNIITSQNLTKFEKT